MNMRRRKGITLISLVITIIILIVLAGVTINLTIGENEIINRTKYAREEYSNEAIKEEHQINEIDNYIEEQTNEENKTKKLKYDITKLDDKIKLYDVYVNEDGIMDVSKTGSYVVVDEVFVPGNSNWEVGIKFNYNSLTDNYQTILGKDESHSPAVVLIDTSGKLCLDISSNGVNWNIASKKIGTKILQANKWYWLKLKFDGNSYKVLISENGKEYIEDIKVNSSVVVYQSGKYVLGENLYRQGMYEFNGFYDLKEIYISIEEDYFFNGLDYFSY